MSRQAELAKKAGIYGFCIYHYWFGNDKKLLEKPAENLLQWKDIDMNYCFSWANESWVRSWSKFDGNSWMVTEDNKELNQGMLVQQEYGDEKEWKKHFEYLLPFFRDQRYIKKDNKPVFVIYKPENIKRIRLIVQYWNLLARKQGFDGIYFIGTNDPKWKKDGLNAELLYEPQYTFGDRPSALMMKMQKVLKRNNIHFLQLYSYDKFWKKILNRKIKEKTYRGGFVDYDDTPRKGVDGIVVNGMTPRKFGNYFRQLYNKAADRGDEYVFLTAWNEWGEGAYLEPDEDFKYGYLEAVKRVMDDIDQTDIAYLQLDEKYMDLSERRAALIDERLYRKKEKYYELLNRWVVNRERDKKIEQVLISMQIKNIAIYGMGDFGKHLVRELENSMVNIQLCFDKRTDFLYMENPSKYIQNHYADLDAVIVTPFLEYKEIRLFLKNYFSVPIMSLEELISECEIL